MTGAIKLASDPVAGEDAVNKSYLDDIIANKTLEITALQNAVSQMQSNLASKQYVDDRVNEALTRVNAVGLQRN